MKYTFEKFKLNEKILKSLKSLEYNIPSRVQREVIPKLLKGQNLVVKSKQEVERQQVLQYLYVRI